MTSNFANLKGDLFLYKSYMMNFKFLEEQNKQATHNFMQSYASEMKNSIRFANAIAWLKLSIANLKVIYVNFLNLFYELMGLTHTIQHDLCHTCSHS